MGLSLQISCTRMRFMQSYLLALPNIVWPRRSLSKQKRQQMSYCFPVMLGRTHHYRPPPSISADETFLASVLEFPDHVTYAVLPLCYSLYWLPMTVMPHFWNVKFVCVTVQLQNLLLRHSFRIHAKWV